MSSEDNWTPYADLVIGERAVDETATLNISFREALKHFYAAISSFDHFAAKVAMAETLAFLHKCRTADGLSLEYDDFYDVCRALRTRERSPMIEIDE